MKKLLVIALLCAAIGCKKDNTAQPQPTASTTTLPVTSLKITYLFTVNAIPVIRHYTYPANEGFIIKVDTIYQLSSNISFTITPTSQMFECACDIPVSNDARCQTAIYFNGNLSCSDSSTVAVFTECSY